MPFIWAGKMPGKTNYWSLFGQGLGAGMLEEMELEKQREPVIASMATNLWYASDPEGQRQMLESPGWKERVVPLLNKYGVITTPQGALPSREDKSLGEKLGLALQMMGLSRQVSPGLEGLYEKVTGIGWPTEEKVMQEPLTGYTAKEWEEIGGAGIPPISETRVTRPWRPMSKEEETAQVLQAFGLQESLKLPFKIREYEETIGKEKARERAFEAGKFKVTTDIDLLRLDEQITQNKLRSRQLDFDISKWNSEQATQGFKDFSTTFDKGTGELNKNIMTGGVEDRKGAMQRLEGLFQSYVGLIPKLEYTMRNKVTGQTEKVILPKLDLIRGAGEKMAGAWVTELIALANDTTPTGEAYRNSLLINLNKLFKALPDTPELSEMEQRVATALTKTGRYTYLPQEVEGDRFIYSPEPRGRFEGVLEGLKNLWKYR